MEEFKDSIWIFGNFNRMKPQFLMKFIKDKINYHVIEYDFKFCQLRSPKKHILLGDTCKCHTDYYGKLVSLFFSKSQCLWFMSHLQKKEYERRFPFLTKNSSHVLSSIFEPMLLQKMIDSDVKKTNQWVILESNSWIKGMSDCVAFARDNNLPFRLVGGVSHEEMLKTLSESRGLIFLPRGGDTCPRIVIEAFLLGCDLKLNENVLHKDEPWFSKTKLECVNYLKNRATFFWETLEGTVG